MFVAVLCAAQFSLATQEKAQKQSQTQELLLQRENGLDAEQKVK